MEQTSASEYPLNILAIHIQHLKYKELSLATEMQDRVSSVFFLLKCACTLTYGHTYDSDTCTFKSRGFITGLDKTTKHIAEKENIRCV